MSNVKAVDFPSHEFRESQGSKNIEINLNSTSPLTIKKFSILSIQISILEVIFELILSIPAHSSLINFL